MVNDQGELLAFRVTTGEGDDGDPVVQISGLPLGFAEPCDDDCTAR